MTVFYIKPIGLYIKMLWWIKTAPKAFLFDNYLKRHMALYPFSFLNLYPHKVLGLGLGTLSG